MKKHIPNLIFIVGLILLAVYAVRSHNGALMTEPRQIALRYTALFVLVAGMAVRTLINRRENVSETNFGFKLIAVGVVFLIVLISLIKAVWF